MLQAELHNKDSSKALIKDMEDILTSNVFGVLKNVDGYFIGEVLKRILGIKWPRKEAFEILFWSAEYKRHYDKNFSSEPDCIIKTKKNIILMEAKYHSDFGVDLISGIEDRNQLRREFALLRHMKNITGFQDYLLIVTEDLFEPVERIQKQFGSMKKPPNVYWTSWQEINSILKEAVESYDNKCKYSLLWIKELIELLDYKGLRNFKGFDVSAEKEAIMHWTNLIKQNNLFFDSINNVSFVGFSGFKSVGQYLLTKNRKLRKIKGDIFYENMEVL